MTEPPIAPLDYWEAPEAPAVFTPPAGCSAVFTYLWADGSPAFKVARWEAHYGHQKKDFRQFSLDGNQWVPRQMIPAGEQPLYNLPDIVAHPDAKILLVEGEKKVVAAAKYLPEGWIVTCWAGGAMNFKSADSTHLKRRTVVIWPDNDKAGDDAAAAIKAILPHAVRITVPVSFPPKWDLADPLPEGHDAAWVWAKIQAAMGDATQEAPAPTRGTPYGKLVYLTDQDATTAPRRNYFLKGMLSPNEMSVWYGEPGCGKSFLALYIARALSQNREVFGRRVKIAKVLFMALEGISGFEKRLNAEIKKHPDPAAFGYIAQPVNLFSDDAAKEDVIKAIQATKSTFIVIDTLNRALAEGSENAPEDMGRFIQNIDAIRGATAAHVMIIHHSGKDSARGMRGHSSLLGAADVSIEVAKIPDSKHRAATVLKAKDDADGARLTFMLDLVEMGDDDDGDKVTTCTVREIEDIDLPKRSKENALTKMERLWFETLQEAFMRETSVKVVVPEPGMQPQSTITRTQAREWFLRRGLIGVTENVTDQKVISQVDRNKISNILNALNSKKKIGINNNHIWLT